MAPTRDEIEFVSEALQGTVSCYRCSHQGRQRDAVAFKWMKTPTGGKYRRGWCNECLREKDIDLGLGDVEPTLEGEPIPEKPEHTVPDRSGDPVRPYKAGAVVTATITGEVKYYLNAPGQGGYPPPRAVLDTEWGRLVVPTSSLQEKGGGPDG